MALASMAMTKSGSKMLMAAIAVMIAVAAPAAAQTDWINPDVIDLRERVDRLTRDVERLRGGGGGGGGVSSDAFVRIDRMEIELRRLTGVVERLEYGYQQALRQRDQRILDLQYRMQVLEAEFGGPAPQQPEPFNDSLTGAQGAAGALGDQLANAQIGPQGAQHDHSRDDNLVQGVGQPPQVLGEIVSDGSGISGDVILDQPNFDAGGAQVAALQGGAGDYQAALNNLRSGDYDAAAAEFQGFIDKNPGDPRIGEATYWIGESHFVKGQHDVAARAFLRSFREHPDSPKAPDSLLKLGMALAQLDQNNEACLTFKEVPARYPDASSSVLRRANIEARRAGCE